MNNLNELKSIFVNLYLLCGLGIFVTFFFKFLRKLNVCSSRIKLVAFDEAISKVVACQELRTKADMFVKIMNKREISRTSKDKNSV